MKALIGGFNQEKALVGAFFKIVKPSRTTVWSSNEGTGADYFGLTRVEFQCGYDILTKTGRMEEEFGEKGRGAFDGGILWLLNLWNRMTEENRKTYGQPLKFEEPLWDKKF